jgi:hypothetical protein
MTIDARKEELVPLSQAPAYVPGGPPSAATIARWARQEHPRLETTRVGGRRFTSVEAIHRFVEACNDSADETAMDAVHLVEKPDREI